MILTQVEFVSLLIVQFFAYSLMGWCTEVVLKYLQYHRFINRGFLIGPYCPIYGMGALIMTTCIGGTISSYAGYLATFALAFAVCGVLEFTVSYVMEKLFHARWWDYSQKPMNLQGRIWIGNLILFGLAGIVIVKWINPPFFDALLRLPQELTAALAAVIVLGMLADGVLSTLILRLVRQEIDTSGADNTEEISRHVHALLRSRSALARRLSEAFPNMTAAPAHVMAKVHEEEERLAQAMHDGGEKLHHLLEKDKVTSDE